MLESDERHDSKLGSYTISTECTRAHVTSRDLQREPHGMDQAIGSIA